MVHASLNALADGVLAWRSDQVHEPRRMTRGEEAGSAGVAGGGILGDTIVVCGGDSGGEGGAGEGGGGAGNGEGGTAGGEGGGGGDCGTLAFFKPLK